MSIDPIDLLRWSLYVVTAVLGIALVFWFLRDRALRRLELQRDTPGRVVQLRRTVAAIDPETPPPTMVQALAGIRLPVHWSPCPAPEVASPVVLTTDRDAPEHVAQVLSDELVRLGYRVRPIADNAARAWRGVDHLRVQVDSEPAAVVATITLTGQFVG